MSAHQKIYPKKSHGQHFLHDKHIVEKIIESAHLHPDDVVLEIGPGKGVLTFEITKHVKKVIAIEKDRDLIPFLRNHEDIANIEIIEGDILKFDFASLPRNLKIIGNLPYYISSPILEKVIEHRDHFQSMYMMLQLEFAKRLVAPVGSKDYSSLTLFAKYYADTKILFPVSRGAFSPAPKVQSAFAQMIFKKNGGCSSKDETFLFQTIRRAFQNRRKTIENSLSQDCPKEDMTKILQTLKLKKNLRAENLTLDDYIRVTNEMRMLKR
jgi:16S rRNA (adenine1518-N6/adenine1519-N6)-dimethyltransferase